MPFITPSVSSLIQWLRGLSALLVVLAHARALIMPDYSQLASHSVWTAAFYFVSGLGREAVVVFFVLSGLLVGGTTSERIKSGAPFEPLKYLIARFTRIYLPFIPILFFGALLDYIGLTYLNTSMIYTDPSRFGSGSIPPHPDYGLSTFLGNGLMLQRIFVQPYGTNGSLWSLSYEWWYYGVFCLFAAAYSHRNIIFLLAGTGLFILLPSHMQFLAAQWALGAILPLLSERILNFKIFKSPHLGISQFAFTLITIRLIAIKSPSSLAKGFDATLLLHFVLAISTIIMIASFRKSNFSRQFYPEKFSYSLYLIHAPVLTFLMALSYGHLFGVSMKSPLGGIVLVVISILTCCLLANICYLAFEQHTVILRRFISGMINVNDTPTQRTRK